VEGLYGKTAIIACALRDRTAGRDAKSSRATVNTLFSRDYAALDSSGSAQNANICAKCNVDVVELLIDKKNILPSLAILAEL